MKLWTAMDWCGVIASKDTIPSQGPSTEIGIDSVVDGAVFKPDEMAAMPIKESGGVMFKPQDVVCGNLSMPIDLGRHRDELRRNHCAFRHGTDTDYCDFVNPIEPNQEFTVSDETSTNEMEYGFVGMTEAVIEGGD